MCQCVSDGSRDIIHRGVNIDVKDQEFFFPGLSPCPNSSSLSTSLAHKQPKCCGISFSLGKREKKL